MDSENVTPILESNKNNGSTFVYLKFTCNMFFNIRIIVSTYINILMKIYSYRKYLKIKNFSEKIYSLKFSKYYYMLCTTICKT